LLHKAELLKIEEEIYNEMLNRNWGNVATEYKNIFKNVISDCEQTNVK
jgi:hypothetical protein